jgi:sterol desaturase/sphingolipid hydroxylase (fatty acid hydroxylase superfamily)
MKNTDPGLFDEKGHWRPSVPPKLMPIWERPFVFKDFLKSIFGWGGWLWPRNLILIGFAVFTWFFLQPGFTVTAQFSPGWMLFMLVRNVILLLVINVVFHLLLWTFRLKGKERKYNPNWLDRKDTKFTFNNQVADNLFWSIISGGIIWTGYEILYMWMAANGYVPLITWGENGVWFFVWFLLIPFWRDSHFYFIHRFIHFRFLYKTVHHIHHRNTNPTPLSGTSMHPVEHLLYFSSVLIHFVIPSHPVLFLMSSQLTALTPPHGHDGFEGPLLRGIFPAGDRMHYLHHKHISCNYGTPATPFDKWIGSYYNGEGKYPFKLDWKKKKP